MKSSSKTGTRRSEGYNEFAVHLPDPKLLLRVITRLILLATAIMSFPWLCNIFQPDSPDAAINPELVDDPFSLPMTIEKIPHFDGGEFKVARRLLSDLRSKKEALEGLEDAFLEQPEAEEKKIKKINYLPDVMGDNWLVGYPRRVFVDVGTKKRARKTDWFEREYPTKGAEFEIVKVDLVEREGGGIGDWLEKNVRVEEFVVMAADADVVEEMVRGNVIDLVDELFLECNTQGKRSSRRAYWECLALYGRVKDEGVAVHQWWE